LVTQGDHTRSRTAPAASQLLRASWPGINQEARLSDSEPIAFPRQRTSRAGPSPPPAPASRETTPVIAFTRLELSAILAVYGRRVAAGDWRDYAIDMGRDVAVFSVFRRVSEVPIYRIEKNPRLARKQGAYAVITATGLILKRGPDLERVLAVLEKGMRLVD
jgi:hypothetical protein